MNNCDWCKKAIINELIWFVGKEIYHGKCCIGLDSKLREIGIEKKYA